MAEGRMIEVDETDLYLVLLSTWTEQQDEPRRGAIARLRAKVSEGVGHSQTDRAPSDVPQSGPLQLDVNMREHHTPLWPETTPNLGDTGS